MTRAAVALAAAALCACGPSLKEIRAYVARSPHRVVVLYPLDRQGGIGDVTPQTTSFLEGKLRQAGFAVVGRARTQVVYSSSTLRGRSFTELAQAVQLAWAWKPQAVLVGEVRGAFEERVRAPAEFTYPYVTPPACCSDRQRPCPSYSVLDAQRGTYGPSCAGWHKKVQVRAARDELYAGMTVRLRLVDAAAQKILWETSYDLLREPGSLPALADRMTDVLADQLEQAYLKQKL